MTNWRYRLGGNLLYTLARLTRRTARYEISGQEHFEAANNSGQPVIMAAWHGMTMLLIGFFWQHHDLRRIVLPLPDDWRGEILAVFIAKLGAKPFRLNLHGDESLGTARSLLQLVRELKQGSHCYITPDGPGGPAYQIKPGVAFMTQKAKAILLPVGAFTRTAYRVNRWDQYCAPYPFSRICVVVGKPVEVPASASYANITDSLTDALHRVSAQAITNYYA